MGLGTRLTVPLPARARRRRSTSGRSPKTLATIACTDHCTGDRRGRRRRSGHCLSTGRHPPRWSSPRSSTAGTADAEWVTVVLAPRRTSSPRHRPDCDRGCVDAASDAAGAGGRDRPAGRAGWRPWSPARPTSRSWPWSTTALAAIGRGELVKVVLARHVDVTVGHAHRRARPPPPLAPTRTQLHHLLGAHPERAGSWGPAPSCWSSGGGPPCTAVPWPERPSGRRGRRAACCRPSLLESRQGRARAPAGGRGHRRRLSDRCAPARRTRSARPGPPAQHGPPGYVAPGHAGRAGRPCPTALQLVAALHPTPAVGAYPPPPPGP